MLKPIAFVLTVCAASASTVMVARAADSQNGALLFDNYCSDCHAARAGAVSRKGPNLFGVVGRKTASVPGFDYSDAHKAAGWVWTAENLNRYIADPRAATPGTTMKFKGAFDPAERADIIAYLATLR